MAKKKYILKSPMVNKNDSLSVGDEISLDEDEAFVMHQNGDITVKDEDIQKLKKRQAQKLEEEDKKARELELLLQKDELKAEKKTIQARLKEIDKTLEGK